MILLLRVPTLASWEAWGGVAALVAAGASTLAWRTRPDAAASQRSAALAALAGIALAAGALAQGAAVLPALGLVGLAFVALPATMDRRWRVGSFVLLAAAMLAGYAWVGWSTSARVGQTGAAFALGALVANAVDEDASWVARFIAATIGVALATLLA